jgi:hypothetical protein
MLSKRPLLTVLLVCSFLLGSAQHIYYKRMIKDSLELFNDTVHKVKFIYKDSSYKEDLSLHFKYVLRFFPSLEFNSIKVIFKPSKRVSRVKPSFWCFFQSPEKRTYKVILSSRSNPTLDSVLMKNLSFNSQLGMIASEIGSIKDLSTDGFFELIGWHVRQMTRKPRKRQEHDNDMKVLEAGCGYLLMALSEEEEEKLQISRWHNAHAYATYFRHYKNHFMTPDGIRNFIQDMPVYVTHKYR